ncbi:MAG TPA: ATP synthase F1 subunit epsilon [Bacteroidia bacterium]|nr:ATP synthase F1 subunit epsilon [Bacteroidia bacterium]HRS59066.1 ATP synthase F1 subunit epsilon [Bacteroidia bacterium]HRU68968.1 ATP synthase F1 subunit epsilon [Bacteroidia bacterium]
MKLEIISPDQVIFEGEVVSVQLPGTSGYFEVLNDHAPIISSLKEGKIRIILPNGDRQVFKITKGFVEVIGNKVTVLA